MPLPGRMVPWALILLAGGVLTMVTATTRPALDDAARQFIADHEARLRPLEHQVGLAWWNANVSGKDEDFARKEELQNQLDAALADTGRFGELKKLRFGKIEDETLKRQIEVLYLQYLEKQVDPELLRKINAKANAVEKAFNVFRAKVDGQELADSEVRKILKESTDSARRQAVWEASKRVGAEVEADLRELVALRNEAARRLGFADYHKMMLFLSEQDQVRLFNLFDELDELTREPFRQVKGEIDAKLCSLYGLSHEQLRPWHLHDPFFQEPADIFDYKLDPVYAKADILALCRQFFGGIGLPVDEVLARSDLYEKPGKSPHAFCIDIDREGDVRVLANIVPNEYWMATMLHELGHAVYSSKTIPNRMPYVLRTEAHILTTEGVAMLFEKFSKSAAWLEKMGVTVDDPAAFDAAGRRMLRHQLLIFSRWCQVMLRFERAMYEHPDQDLNKLWWDLVEKYQMVRRPDGRSAPDYASKIHICSAPVYYHNYMMGQLFASQVHHTLSREVLRCAPSQANYVGKHSVGQFLRERVFAPGRSLNWNALTKHATGEELNAKAFAADFGGN